MVVGIGSRSCRGRRRGLACRGTAAERGAFGATTGDGAGRGSLSPCDASSRQASSTYDSSPAAAAGCTGTRAVKMVTTPIVRVAGDNSLSRIVACVEEGLEVRRVRPEECAEAGAVTARAYEEYARPASPDWDAYLARIADVAGRAGHTTVLVALQGGRVVGTATVELERHIEADWHADVPRDCANLRMVGVDPSQRRRGTARALVAACIDLARAAGRTRITLDTTEQMHAAHALYQSMGFRPTGPHELGPGLCFDGYELNLEPADASAV